MNCNCEVRATGGFEPDDAEYAAANEVLSELPDTEPLYTGAIAEPTAVGIPKASARQIAVRAADLATRPAILRQPGDGPAPRLRTPPHMIGHIDTD